MYKRQTEHRIADLKQQIEKVRELDERMQRLRAVSYTHLMTIATPLPPCMPFPRALTGFPVSSTAKVMYCRMLDAILSKGQEDENGILFVCFPVTAIAAVLSRSPMTVKRSLNELETAGPVSYTHLDVYKRQGRCIDFIRSAQRIQLL